MAFKSIRSRLTAWYVTLLGIILILFSVFLNYFLSKRLYESVDNSLTVSATVVATSAVMQFNRSPLPGLDSFFEQFMGAGNLNKFYRIYDGSGNVGSRSKNIDASQFPLSQAAYADAIKGANSYETFLVDGKHSIRVITMPIIREKKLVNLVQVGTSLEAVQETLRNLRIFLFTAVPSVLVLATLFARFMARRALKPISRIIQTARDIGQGQELNQRIPVLKVQDELGQLALTFNEMMDRLENSFAQMRQFSSDASHELRTPLTVLKGQNELILSKKRDPEEYQEVIASNLEEINYMSKVLEDLFVLSRSDENQILLNCKHMDLRDLVEEVCKHAEVLAGDKDIRIIIAFLESVMINGDEVRLRQMIWNILHNGIKYTKPGGELKVSLQNEGKFALLSIQDTGIGIPEKDLPSIFDRFYRVDKARSRDEGGSGLGLSICQHIAEAHKGKIEVESKPSVGTRFKIRIPSITPGSNGQ
ncbi:MAG: heavy metal sensor histidine kinase [Nitrospina sp.]|jgi:two-component system, OmpR family, sensor kinase|nr:heavy metal sensor histidine kinase [Nitrospina sp.]MBT5632142.1 heavy metal sensor histidine kinase [Nitrospina sp.]